MKNYLVHNKDGTVSNRKFTKWEETCPICHYEGPHEHCTWSPMLEDIVLIRVCGKCGREWKIES